LTFAVVRALLRGTELRQLPVALRLHDLPIVRTFLRCGGGTFEVTGLDVPASLKPFVIGIRETAAWPHVESRRWRFEVRLPTAVVLGSMTLEPIGRITLSNEALALFRPAHARTMCVGSVERSWRYFLAWRRARAAGNSGKLTMTAADLRALDVYYQRPRPVWLVTVPHCSSFNIFPMDLLDTMDGGRLFLALRSSSPSIPFMRQRCAIALSAVPATFKEVIYRLGAHHKVAYASGIPLPFATVRSAGCDLIVPEPAFAVSEWMLGDSVEVGSHTCFMAERVSETRTDSGSQLAHVSAMFARGARAVDLPFTGV
jgi:hypothetical protein